MRDEKLGVLLVNLGTPDSPTISAVKRYLKQFLSDPRVIDKPRWLWWFILNFIVLPFRSVRISKMYQLIWTKQGSPLIVFSKRQRDALEKRINVPIELGMRYGQPSLDSAVQHLLSKKVNKMIVLPLYPQFSCATVASVWDGLSDTFKKLRSLPEVIFIRDYAEHPAYIAALKASIEHAFVQYGEPDLLVLSYHGIPQRFAYEGDDYPQRCQDTTNALLAAINIAPNKIMMTFQSHFGSEPWLMPYTKKIMKSLPDKGVKHVQIMSPGFAADCLETLVEIAQQNCKFFLDAGGEKIEYIPALNVNQEHIEMMAQLISVRF